MGVYLEGVMVRIQEILSDFKWICEYIVMGVLESFQWGIDGWFKNLFYEVLDLESKIKFLLLLKKN